LTEKDHTITIPDGRQITIREAGNPEGIPVMTLHGTPGSKYLFPHWIEDALEKNIRLIGYDRPGYGGSTPKPGRSVADVAQDVAALAKALGIERLLIWGISGGGPHAIACAALLPDLVAAAASLASPVPYTTEGFDWMAGMGEGNIEEFGAALEGRATLEAYIEDDAAGLLKAKAEDLVEGMKSLLSPPDVAILTKDFTENTLQSVREGIEEHREGWVDDDLAFISDWGFSLEQIKVPMLLMQGAHDKMVPFSHGEWLAAHIPGVDARLLPDDGHLSLKMHIPEVHAWLLDKFS
jgi:pimeloyl-ACP methyl ester carboxylesterase